MPTWAFLVEVAGGAVRVNYWLLDTAVFHLTPAPTGPPDWASAAVLLPLTAGYVRPVPAGKADAARFDDCPDNGFDGRSERRDQPTGAHRNADLLITA